MDLAPERYSLRDHDLTNQFNLVEVFNLSHKYN